MVQVFHHALQALRNALLTIQHCNKWWKILGKLHNPIIGYKSKNYTQSCRQQKPSKNMLKTKSIQCYAHRSQRNPQAILVTIKSFSSFNVSLQQEDIPPNPPVFTSIGKLQIHVMILNPQSHFRHIFELYSTMTIFMFSYVSNVRKISTIPDKAWTIPVAQGSQYRSDYVIGSL